MAKLSAYGRKEYVRGAKGSDRIAYMSDGAVLYKNGGGIWRVHGTWAHHTPVRHVREALVAAGWTLVETALERDWRRAMRQVPVPKVSKEVKRGTA